MPRLVLHAGQPKTGTTAIQQFCAANRDALHAEGYLYASAGRDRGNHKFLVMDILGRPQQPSHKGAALQFRDEIHQLSLPNVIVSSESLFSHLLAHGTQSEILRFFAASGLETDIVIFIRPDAERINSDYVQQTKTFLRSDDFETFARRGVKQGVRAYARLLQLKEALGSRLTFVPYNRRVAENGAVRSFLAAIGLPEDVISGFGPERRANESVGPIAIAAARHTVASMHGRGPELSKKGRRLLSGVLKDLIGQEPPEKPFQGLDEVLVASIDLELAEEREQFARGVWGRSWAEVFPAKERKPCNVFDPANAEGAEVQRYERFLAALSPFAETLVAGAPAPTQGAVPLMHEQDRGGAETGR